jgi:hypothetical protein
VIAQKTKRVRIAGITWCDRTEGRSLGQLRFVALRPLNGGAVAMRVCRNERFGRRPLAATSSGIPRVAKKSAGSFPVLTGRET